MINKISLTQFQSHEQSELSFCDGLNVIVGRSDSGKTSILRALDWVINNRPGGDAFRRRGSKETEVEIKLDGNHITRRKGQANTYEMNAVVGTGFGREVPKEISTLLNMGAINIQRQFDGPFLLTESSGEVARRLNEIADLQIIDTTIANNNKDLRDTTAEITNCEQMVGESEARVALFAFLGVLEKKLDRLLSLEEKQYAVETAAKSLGFTVDKVQRQLQQSTYEWVDDAEKEVSVLDRTTHTLLGVSSSIAGLDDTNNSIEEVQRDIEYYTEITKAEKSLKRLEKLLVEQKVAKEQLIELENLVVGIEDLNENIRVLAENVFGFEEDWKELMPDECPLCGMVKEKGAKG